MKVRYSLKRTINTGNFENLVIEYELETEITNAEQHDELIAKVEKFIEDKDEEIRKQLEG